MAARIESRGSSADSTYVKLDLGLFDFTWQLAPIYHKLDLAATDPPTIPVWPEFWRGPLQSQQHPMAKPSLAL
jgi:hypothetical protein